MERVGLPTVRCSAVPASPLRDNPQSQTHSPPWLSSVVVSALPSPVSPHRTSARTPSAGVSAHVAPPSSPQRTSTPPAVSTRNSSSVVTGVRDPAASEKGISVATDTSAAAPCVSQSATPVAAAARRPWRVWRRCRLRAWVPRLHLLSPTTEMDIGAAEYSTVYPRVCAVEYLIGLLITACVIPYGFAAMYGFCVRHQLAYLHHVRLPPPIFATMGSAGYDHFADRQWVSLRRNAVPLLALAALLGLWTALCRRVQTDASHTSAAVTPPAVSAVPLPAAPPAMPLVGPSPSSAYRNVGVAVMWLRCVLRCVAGHRWSIPTFYAVVGFFFVAIVHGPHFFLPLVIIAANYAVFARLQRCCPYWVFMALMWTAHVGLLYVIEVNEGFEETYWLQYLLPTRAKVASAVTGVAQQPLWRQRMRWYVAYRMTTLRLIAFNYDLWEATHCAARARERAAEKHDTTCVECAQLREQNSAAALPAEASRCYKYRTEHVRDLADYGFVNYVAYVLFPPLYLAGPMSSFNAFVSYMRVPSTAMPLRKMARYAFGIVRLGVTEFTLMSFIHVSALAIRPHLILRMTLLEQCHYLVYMLAYLWLKFSLIWKSSRLFAMFSGIEVPEDMRRCFANTLTVRDFWRDWHASFNLWIVRYMYIPMGGRSRVALSVLPIFLFIAVWHDPALHLLKWALCIAVMFVAELVVSGCFGVACRAVSREIAAAEEGTSGAADEEAMEPSSVDGDVARAPHRRTAVARLARVWVRHTGPRLRAFAFRQCRAVGGMSTVFALIVANLIGFAMHTGSATRVKLGSTEVPADAESVIRRSFAQFTPWFTSGLLLSLYVVSALAVIDRDMERHRRVWLKQRYQLR